MGTQQMVRRYSDHPSRRSPYISDMTVRKIFFYLPEAIFGKGNSTPLQYSCLENPMGGGVWQAAVHGVAKSQTRLSDFTFTFHFHALEKEMATHSSVLAWRIPGTGEPGELPSMGSHSRTRLKRLSSSSSPTFPTSPAEDSVFFPLYILSSFVDD